MIPALKLRYVESRTWYTLSYQSSRSEGIRYRVRESTSSLTYITLCITAMQLVVSPCVIPRRHISHAHTWHGVLNVRNFQIYVVITGVCVVTYIS